MQERIFGSFERVVPLPEGATKESESLDASFQDGVLTIRVPKPEPSPTKSISIKRLGEAASSAAQSVASTVSDAVSAVIGSTSGEQKGVQENGKSHSHVSPGVSGDKKDGGYNK